MAKQSIFGRISTLVKANINALLDAAKTARENTTISPLLWGSRRRVRSSCWASHFWVSRSTPAARKRQATEACWDIWGYRSRTSSMPTEVSCHTRSA